jgi:hypothetical protein
MLLKQGKIDNANVEANKNEVDVKKFNKFTEKATDFDLDQRSSEREKKDLKRQTWLS